MRLIQLFEAPNINDPREVRDRINTYQRIIDTSHHQGEKDAAQNMMNKLKAAAKAAGTNWESGGTSHQTKSSGAKSTYDTWKARQQQSSRASSSKTNDPGPAQWTKVNATINREGQIKHIILSKADMTKHGIPTASSGYGARCIFRKGGAFVVVYQSDRRGDEFGVSVRTTEFSNMSDVESLANFLAGKAHSNHDPKWEMRDKFASNVHMPIDDVMEVQEYGNVWVAYFRNVDNPKTFDVAEWNYVTKSWITQHPFPNYSSQAEAKVAFEKAAQKRKTFQDGFGAKQSSDSTGTGPFKVYFVGHFQDATSDKVWGWGTKGDKLYQFWGRRNGSPQTKVLPNTPANEAALRKLAKQKAAKGYEQKSASEFENWLKTVLKTDPKFSD